MQIYIMVSEIKNLSSTNARKVMCRSQKAESLFSVFSYSGEKTRVLVLLNKAINTAIAIEASSNL